MKLSTVVEIAGFAALVTAAFTWQTTAGVVALGICLLIIGYATEDDAAAVSVARVVDPFIRRHQLRKIRRQESKGENASR